jgi:adenylate kinase
MERHREVVLLLGAPGAGKGTQARFISDVLGVPHVASGDLLREHRRLGTELGRAAQAYMDRGDLVPDELVIAMVMERLDRPDAERGALLDGFPRTRPQAEALRAQLAERGGAVQAVLYLAVPETVLIERLAGRWMCGHCQATSHEQFKPPRQPGVCDLCQAALSQRPDDRREVVANRVEVYLRDTQPLIDYYAAQGVLHRVDGHDTIERVRAALCAALGGVVHGLRRDRWHLYLRHPRAVHGNGHEAWLGRTLCGKYVDRDGNRVRGTLTEFWAASCRDCLRAVQGSPVDREAAPKAPHSSGEALGSSA